VARGRGPAARTARSGRRARTNDVDVLRNAADGFLSRFESLVAEVEDLRDALLTAQRETQQLRAELADGVDILTGAETLLARAGHGPAQSRGRGRGEPAGRGAAAPATDPGRPARRVRRTPTSVTADVVRAVIGRLGDATAAEIAEEITRSGTPVSGRAIRHIAKAAGAEARAGADGRMVYRLG
jgi:hypothetical protein